ncbi:MAG TPA: RNA polymerase sigma factor [Vicinamibacteria bacterium]
MPRKHPLAPKPLRSDDDLVEGIRRASEADFNALYERYFQRVYSFAFARLRNRADTEEVVQETFMAVLRSIDAYRGQSTLLCWIYGIAKNNVNNHLRRAKSHELRVERAEPGMMLGTASLDTSTPEEQLSLQRYQESVQKLLSNVADWQTEVFWLRHVENLPIGEIALRVRRSNDAVRSSLYRVKRMLVEAVDPKLVAAS